MYLTPDGEIVCKVVLFGSAGAGKGSNMKVLLQSLQGRETTPITTVDLGGETAQSLIHVAGPELDIEGHPLRFHLLTISGRSRFVASRKALLEGADGIVFVADSRREALDDNIDTMNEMLEHMRELQLPNGLPLIIQYNHRDQSSSIPPEQLDPLLNHQGAPSFETVAARGQGVTESFATLGQILIAEAAQALPGLQQGPTPGQTTSAQGWLISCCACGAMLEIDEVQRGEVFSCGSCGAAIQVTDPETGRTQLATSEVLMPQTSQITTDTYAPDGMPSSTSALTPQQVSPVSGGQFPLPGFELLAELDSSPLGQRYRVRDLQKGRDLRVFQVDVNVTVIPGLKQQMEPYAHMAGKVSHPHILPLSGMRTHGPHAYLLSHDAPNYEPLATILARRRTLQPVQALDIARQVALGLEEAARQGVVHGHLRPEIILVAADGRVLVDGLGLPKPHTHLIQVSSGATDSTEYYLAPEHLLVDSPTDIRSDFFLLGAVLHRMLTGDGLVTGFTAVDALHRFSATDSGNLTGLAHTALPRDMESVLAKLTASDRKDRYQHYGEVIEALERLITVLNRGPIRTTGGTRRTTGATRRGTGSTGRGTGRIRAGTAQTRRVGTGQLPRPGTAQTRRVGTGPLPRGTGSHNCGTGRTTRGTGPIPRTTGSIQRTTGNHRRSPGGTTRDSRKKNNNGTLIALLVVMVLSVAVGVFFLINSKKEGGGILGGNTTAQNNLNDPQPVTQVQKRQNAEAAIAKYSQAPGDETLYQAARQALTGVVGQRRAALDARLRRVRDAYEAAQVPETNGNNGTETAGNNNNGGGSTTTAPPLSAQEKSKIAGLIRTQEFAAALAHAEEVEADPFTLDFYRKDINRAYEEAKAATAKAVAGAQELRTVRRYLAPAMEKWGMEGDVAWAEGLLAAASERLPEEAAPDIVTIPDEKPEVPETPVETPTDGNANPNPDTVVATDEGDKSPAGFTAAELDADRAMAAALRNREDVAPALQALPADSVVGDASALRAELWQRKQAAITNALAVGDRKLRVTNPVAGGLWDVSSVDDKGFNIKSPAGSSMSLRWQDVKAADESKLFKELVKSTGAGPEDIATAAVVNLTYGHDVYAKILIASARRAGYEKADLLDTLVLVNRDQNLMQLINRGEAAIGQNDSIALEEVTAALEQSAAASDPMVVAKIEAFRAASTAIASGKLPTTSKLKDLLTFESPEDRLSFPERVGWILSDGAYASTGTASQLSRDDLGNASVFDMSYYLKSATGGFTIDFRGAQVVADVSGKTVSVRTQGSKEQRFDLPLAINTVYSLAMSFDEGTRNMTVTLNRLDPLVVNVKQPKPHLKVSTDTSAQLAIEEIRIQRLGQEKEETLTVAIAEGQELLRGLGLAPVRRAHKDLNTPAILLPQDPTGRTGLVIPLRAEDRGVRFQASGTGKLFIRLGKKDENPEEGQFKTFGFADDGKPLTVTVTKAGESWTLNVAYADGETVIADDKIPEGADSVIVLAEVNATIRSTPEVVR